MVSGSDALTLRGSGVDATTLTSAGTANQFVLHLGFAGVPVTVRDLRVLIPASFPDGPGYGSGVFASNGTLEQMRVASDNPGSSGIASQGNTSLREVTVDTPGGDAARASSGTLTVEDSVLTGREGVHAAATTTATHVTIVKAGGSNTVGLMNFVGSGVAGDSLLTVSNSTSAASTPSPRRPRPLATAPRPPSCARRTRRPWSRRSATASRCPTTAPSSARPSAPTPVSRADPGPVLRRRSRRPRSRHRWSSHRRSGRRRPSAAACRS